MDELARLERALDEVAEPLSFWWRDDDAGRPSPRLEQLLWLSARLDVPLALAVVPSWLTAAVIGSIRRHPQVGVLQHGWAHADHAMPGHKKIELGGMLDRATIIERLRKGRFVLEDALGASSLPVLVPPWNRISPDLLPDLADIGFTGLSTFASQAEGDAADLVQCNPQIDPIAWHAGRGFAGRETLARMVRERLKRGNDEPVGLLTHHLDMDEAAFVSCETVLATLRRHDNTKWPTPARIFAPPTVERIP